MSSGPLLAPEIELLEGSSYAEFCRFTVNVYAPKLSSASVQAEDAVVAVGARARGMPVGLSLTAIGNDRTRARVLSIMTVLSHRRLGIATRLLEATAAECQRRGVSRLTAAYERQLPRAEALEGLLARAGFGPPRFRALVCRCSGAGEQYRTWIGRFQVPRAFEVFPWIELRPEERERLLALEGQPGWYPARMSPFRSDHILERLNSLGLRHRGDVVGWQVNHRLDHRTIRYSTGFVREDLQPLGLMIPLQMESMRLQVESGIRGLDQAVFVVFREHPRMLEFVRRHMAPYLARMDESFEAERALVPGPDRPDA